MKIFSLETKRHLVSLSIGLGLAFHTVALLLTYRGPTMGTWGRIGYPYTSFGWPLRYIDGNFDLDNFFTIFDNVNFWLNLFFWILVSLIVLSLVRYFMYRRYDVRSV